MKTSNCGHFTRRAFQSCNTSSLIRLGLDDRIMICLYSSFVGTVRFEVCSVTEGQGEQVGYRRVYASLLSDRHHRETSNLIQDLNAIEEPNVIRRQDGELQYM